MPDFAKLIVVALLIYLWESSLWLPRRAVILRRRWFKKSWKVIRPGNLLATPRLGLVFLRPFLPDIGIAPCQSPPLLVDEHGHFLSQNTDETCSAVEVRDWADLHESANSLSVCGEKIRISSPRALDRLRQGKMLGEPVSTAVLAQWNQALSPTRAKREWQRWRLCFEPLALMVGLLTIGIFVALPAAYLLLDQFALIGLAAYIWLLMWMIAARLWGISSRVYPKLKSEIRTDAWLCLVVPFHAMRAIEMTAVHAMASTHPAALILSSGDTQNRWLAEFSRKLLFPHSQDQSDALRCAALRPLMDRALSQFGKSCADYDIPRPTKTILKQMLIAQDVTRSIC